MRAFSPSFIEVPLPQGHRFPMAKYAALATLLSNQGWTIQKAPKAGQSDLEMVHYPEYLNKWFSGTLNLHEERLLGFPYSEAMLERSLHSVGGTLAAMQHALEHGYGVNLAGGTHHAFADRGEGFCVFNDLAICAKKALTEGQAQRILIVDLDVHQGNGTAHIFRNEPNVFTLSVHGERNYPFKKETSDLDIGLSDGIEDAAYLEVLQHHLPRVFEGFKPDLVFLQAGVDVLANDRYGRMQLSQHGVVTRDNMVYKLCKRLQIPLVYTMGGGYQREIEVTATTHAASLEKLKWVFTS